MKTWRSSGRACSRCWSSPTATCPWAWRSRRSSTSSRTSSMSSFSPSAPISSARRSCAGARPRSSTSRITCRWCSKPGRARIARAGQEQVPASRRQLDLLPRHARARAQGLRLPVQTAPTAQEAVRLLSGGLHVDVVVTDLELSGHSGFALVASLRADPHHSNTPVIGMTVKPDPQQIALARKLQDLRDRVEDRPAGPALRPGRTQCVV